ncbi:DUF2301 domain-containing membrane protein [Agarivorans sp. 1_MG-2023]|uniref:DUF2301 domain-containing membrane protein n=1 Tax=Agarivorans sp. 1_MG-2023 TaxID=3062634 RepID=UPI0026E1AEF6|nr:DUF2301 domain-containing membrane protein [Agarivorans sp. 1_MG-2023]MDO6763350.1 DUF2301 domain-containing membrane protein [Agarivorans sp. 1_MG-2023]
MADTEHQEQLDLIDTISVLCYRVGWLTLSFSFACACYHSIADGAFWQPLWLLAAASALLAHNLHLYNKAIRYLVQSAAWSAVWLSMAYYLWHWPILDMFALACFYLVFAAVAFKESFCFNLGLLRWLGAVLAVDFLINLSPWPNLRSISLLVIAAVCLYIAVKKCRQPLHYDIGKKANYQL